MSAPVTSAGVIGAGAWGTALAVMAARAGLDVTLWCRSGDLARTINETGENPQYLAGEKLPAGIRATSEQSALAGAGVVFVVAPAQALRAVMAGFAGHLAPGTPALLCAKGIEQKSGLFMHQVLAQSAPGLVPFVLSGPSFARDVVRHLPTAVTLAGENGEAAARLAAALSQPSFRIYSSGDITGTEIGGAVKNVLAIACGIAGGKGLGASAIAALTTRGFAELARLGRCLGAHEQTLSGLSGLGDLLLTCASTQSRNFSCGVALGQGQPLSEILGARNTVCEGVATAGVVVDIAAQRKIEMPVCQAVHAIVSGASTPDAEITRLLARPRRAETE